MDKLLESLKTLFNLITQLKLLAAICDTANDDELELKKLRVKNFFRPVPLGKSINDTAVNYGLIISCSFLDEYNREFVSNDPVLRERIIQLKKITKPITRRINSRWPDLKDYRNYMLAHNFRIKEQSFFSDELSTVTYRVANSYPEFKLLTEFLSILVQCISHQFQDLASQISTTERMDQKINLPKQTVDIELEIKKVREEVEFLMFKDKN